MSCHAPAAATSVIDRCFRDGSHEEPGEIDRRDVARVRCAEAPVIGERADDEWHTEYGHHAANGQGDQGLELPSATPYLGPGHSRGDRVPPGRAALSPPPGPVVNGLGQ